MRSTPEIPTSDGECCVLHPFEAAHRLCHQCGRWHCEGCLVTPWGPRKPALCVECAISRGGVRSTAGAPPVRTPKEIRQVEKGERQQTSEEVRRLVVITPGGPARTEPSPSASTSTSTHRWGRRRSRQTD